MSSCLVFDIKDYVAKILKICNEGIPKGMKNGPIYIEESIKTLINQAKDSPNAPQQLTLLEQALDTYYNNISNPYGAYLSKAFPKGRASLLFNPNIIPDTGNTSFEVLPKSGQRMLEKHIIDKKFKNAPNAKLFFKRSILNDLIETFLVHRSGQSPKYFTSQEEMNQNVKKYKQELLDRIFEYFEKEPFLKPYLKDLPKTIYDEKGVYTRVLEQIKPIIDKELDPEHFTEKVKSLETWYSEYRDQSIATKLPAERFLKAYNAWIMLQDFDTIVQDQFGAIIQIAPDSMYNNDHDLHKYTLTKKASNMYNNWTDSDDIADMTEVISEVTQALIDTSRMYKWGSPEAFTDRYVSFNDFNYVVGLIKKQINYPSSDLIFINSLSGLENISLHTRKVLYDIVAWNRENQNWEISSDGKEIVGTPKQVTWKQLISRINENPQQYMHAIFDILCNTNILNQNAFNNGKKLNDYEKNLIWSFNQEIFGGSQNPRSLFNIHTKSANDAVYQIITQVAASTFPEDYLQYYEQADGSISTRLLQDYAVENIKFTTFHNIQQTAITLSPNDYKRYGITFKPSQFDPSILHQAVITIQDNNMTPLTITTDNFKSVLSQVSSIDEAEKIWNSNKFQSLIRNVLGINFMGDPDLKNAYEEEVGGVFNAIQDISKVLGRVIYNTILNNEFVPAEALSKSNVMKQFIAKQFNKELAEIYKSDYKKETGIIPVISSKDRDNLLAHISNAIAMNNNLLAQAQSKTGEGTALANYTLSRMRNFYQNQIEMQCKKANSATRNLSFVVNSSGLFEGILTRRELKTLQQNQQTTQFSDQQSFQLSFINDFIAGFILDPSRNSYLKNGKVSFLPTVNSDKPQIDGLLVNLNAKSHISDGKGGFKTYMELTDAEIEQEMALEFSPMYQKIITNINTELTKVYDLFDESFKIENPIIGNSILAKNIALLNAINARFAQDESLGKKPKSRIIKGLHNLLTEYNKTHTRNPIMLAEHIHYVFDKEGYLTNNKTLAALYGRFTDNIDSADREILESLYEQEIDYRNIVSRQTSAQQVSNSQAFFSYQDYQTIRDLITMGFKVPLKGSDSIVRNNQKEIEFLRGDIKFTTDQIANPNYQHLIALNEQLKTWVDYDGMMILAKGLVDGKLTSIRTLDQLNKATNLVIHPMLSKMNRLDYLCTQQYTISTVGSHYVHKGKMDAGSVIAEEATRWLASNKRNVAATSTVHLFQNKQLDGIADKYNMAIIEDSYFDLYNIMGNLYLEGHKPLDGGTFGNAWYSPLENNSLGGEAGGDDKKPFGTFYDERYGGGGIFKTATFVGTNDRMRRQVAWRNLQKNMSHRPWIKQETDINGEDIPEILDITKCDFKGGSKINYREAIGNQPIRYKREAHDEPTQIAAYQLVDIKSLGNNQYEIWEVEINNQGVPIGDAHPRKIITKDINGNTQEITAITINNNWDLFTQVFGGYYSLELGLDNTLTWSENSIKLMAYALNNIGYRKNLDKIKQEWDNKYYHGNDQASLEDLENDPNGLDQDMVYQPLKHSDIHVVPNIGAIKSMQFNVNPDGEAVLTGDQDLNFMTMRLAQLGIQLDKEHHADASEVSMPTQIIQALANRSYTTEYAAEVYKALDILTRQTTQPFLDGLQEIIESKNPEKFVETVTNLIIETLVNQSTDDNAINAILKNVLEKAEQGKELTFKADIEGHIAWSDPTISGKLFSTLSTTLTNLAVKMDFAGVLAVICPTDPIEKLYGDKLLSSFARITDDNGNTRTSLPDTELANYQQSVAEGNEVDSDGNNMLIFDSNIPVNFGNIKALQIDVNKISSNTANFGVIIDPQLKTNVINWQQINPQGIVAYRVNFNQYNTESEVNAGRIGNPFSETTTGENTVQQFYDWIITGNNFGNIKATEEFRQAIINKIMSTSENSPILYYKELGRPSHATVIGFLIKNKQYLLQAIKQSKLSKVASLKTQHNYIIEFEDGSKEEITVNTPPDYFRIKNLILSGKKSSVDLQMLDTPVNIDEIIDRYKQQAEESIDDSDETYLELIVANALVSKPGIIWQTVAKELYPQWKQGKMPEELKRYPPGFWKTKENGGISIDKFIENIVGDLPPALYEDQDSWFKVRDLVHEALLTAESFATFSKFKENRIRQEAERLAQWEINELDNIFIAKYGKNLDEYEIYYNEQLAKSQTSILVVKIYEDVQKGRALGAYNVRFTDVQTGNRFQIFDLDSVNLLFTLNNLSTEKEIKGYTLFQKQSAAEQQQVLNKIFKSKIFNGSYVYSIVSAEFPNLPRFDENFIANLEISYPGQLISIIKALYKAIYPGVYNRMQQDLFKLSDNYTKPDRQVYVNGVLIEPMDIKADAYELIMPKIYKTQFGLQEFDDLQTILRDRDFFVKRGLEHFKCKLEHTDYDYELKNFNGDHYYILDKSKGIPEHIEKGLNTIFTKTVKGKLYRTDSNGKVLYELSSKDDLICQVGGVPVIVTDNPLFYVQNLNYNTLKVSPLRVTSESYTTLIDTLKQSKRKNSQNFLKAITNENEEYFDLKTFKQFNEAIDKITYENIKIDHSSNKDFKSVAQLCRIILQNGRELHTSFNESLNLVAGRIPAQSQQSFMTQRVIGFDNSDRNTAMVSTFQLFLQGSDLDIDAVTLLGYEFDKNGKFVSWSPYFDVTSKEMLEASKEIPLPTGEVKNIEANAETNFFEIYDKYFGTLFKHINITSGKQKTKNGVLELQLQISDDPNQVKLLAEFLRDFEKYGIGIKAPIKDGKIIANDKFFEAPSKIIDGEEIPMVWKLFTEIKQGGMGIRHNQTLAIAQQLLDFANTHNSYIKTAEEHLRDKMVKNYIVHYIYKTAASPCNQTEAMVSIDEPTQILKKGASAFAKQSGETTNAPGRVTSKVKMVGEGQAGKSGVGIGAVGIKANSTTQFYISHIINFGSEQDKQKILFKRPFRIGGVNYSGFANMFSQKEFSEVEMLQLENVLKIMDDLTSESQVTKNVAEAIASMLSIAVDNAKDLALAKINSGPKLMGMYVYGMTLGVPTETLIKIMTSPEGLILKALTEGSQFNNDSNAFKILDAIKKLDGNIFGDLRKYETVCRNADNKVLINKNFKDKNGKPIIIRTPNDALFAFMYKAYCDWYEKNAGKLPKKGPNPPKLATSLGSMVQQLIQGNGFEYVYKNSYVVINNIKYTDVEKLFEYLLSEGQSNQVSSYKASFYQLVNFIGDIQHKRNVFYRQGSYAWDLKTLAEGAEEMRILGSILGINKGLKPTASEAEIFKDTIENLIYNRKKILDENPSEDDKIDFHKFMLDPSYQMKCIEKYENVKHSINILHLISKVPHFNSYLKAAIIPTTFFNVVSVKHRTIQKYRQNVYADYDSKKPISLFDFFEADSKRDKEAIIKGLENMVHYKLLTRWLFDNQVKFKIPANFRYFKNKSTISETTNGLPFSEEELTLPLWTPAGLASFKKFMEEVYIPGLIDDPTLVNNEFIKNLIKISYDKTANHESVITYSLQGDLMTKKGRQAELNAKMFADFQKLASLKFPAGLGIDSAIDAFYLYAQYCYLGKKGQKSLMALFDSTNIQSSFIEKFNKFVAKMDNVGNITASEEELITWCAPKGTQFSNLKYAYVTSENETGVSVKQHVVENVRLTEEQLAAYQEAEEQAAEANGGRKIISYDRFTTYKTEHNATNYDRLTRNHFLVPVTSDRVKQIESHIITINETPIRCDVTIQSGMIQDIQLLDSKGAVITDFKEGFSKKSLQDILQTVKETFRHQPLVYITSIYDGAKQEMDFTDIETIINQLINC